MSGDAGRGVSIVAIERPEPIVMSGADQRPQREPALDWISWREHVNAVHIAQLRTALGREKDHADGTTGGDLFDEMVEMEVMTVRLLSVVKEDPAQSGVVSVESIHEERTLSAGAAAVKRLMALRIVVVASRQATRGIWLARSIGLCYKDGSVMGTHGSYGA